MKCIKGFFVVKVVIRFCLQFFGTSSCLYFLNFVYNGKLVEQRLNAR